MRSRMRVPLGFAVAAAVLYLATPTPAGIAVGAPFGVLGLVVRAAAAGVIRKDRELAWRGPYRFTRNPLYFGSFLLAVGVSVMSGRLACAALILIPFFGIYPAVVRREEAHLSGLFGAEYDRFRNRVPVFFPSRIGSGLFESFSFTQYRTNGEYNAALGFLGAVAVLVLKTLG